MTGLAAFGTRLAVDLVAVGVLVFGAYRRGDASRDFPFTCVMLNVVTFALVWSMHQATLDLGLGLGLFAIFGILRYRTEALGVRDLTYLFVAIGLAVINGLDPEHLAMEEWGALNAACVVGAVAFDRRRGNARGRRVVVTYDRLELLHPAARAELLGDLHHRLGLRCASVEVRGVDLLRDTATLHVVLATEEER
ncbi:MAG: DUF4956 domain-containing protein [Myxococcales bacterium]|nr:DUF4956 domain-containing protein [Myxococcales bacterium]